MARAAKDHWTGLTAKQDAFCLQYLINGGNATAAYKMAYAPRNASEKTVNNKAHALLKRGEIGARLRALRAALTEKVIERAAVEKSYVMDRLQDVAERCMQSQAVVDRKGNPVLIETPDGGEAPAYTFQANGANRALELLGKEIGMFVERKESGTPGEFEKLDDEQRKELRERVRQRMVKLGLAKVVPIDRGKPKA